MGEPFASARVVEGRHVSAIACGAPAPPPEGAAFADGIQWWVVDGHVGIVPVIRAYVAAAVLVREHGRFRAAAHDDEEFLVVPAGQLETSQVAALRESGLPVHESESEDRPHPVVDRFRAVQVVERRREAAERRVVATQCGAAPDTWVFVDGPVGGFAQVPGASRVVGVIKTHDTQFLEGDDLLTALTLGAGHRSSVFERTVHGRHAVLSWYLRLWPWSDEDLLHGLVRLERVPGPSVVDEATDVSRWVLAERAPLSAPDARWDRLLYSIREVETYLRAHAGGWR